MERAKWVTITAPSSVNNSRVHASYTPARGLFGCRSTPRSVFAELTDLPKEIHVLIWKQACVNHSGEGHREVTVCTEADVIELKNEQRATHLSSSGDSYRRFSSTGPGRQRLLCATILTLSYRPRFWIYLNYCLDAEISGQCARRLRQTRMILLRNGNAADLVLMIPRLSRIAQLLHTSYLARITVLEELKNVVGSQKHRGESVAQRRTRFPSQPKPKGVMVLDLLEKMLDKWRRNK